MGLSNSILLWSCHWLLLLLIFLIIINIFIIIIVIIIVFIIIIIIVITIIVITTITIFFYFFFLCREMKYIFGNSFILRWTQKPGRQAFQCSNPSASLAVIARSSVACDLLWPSNRFSTSSESGDYSFHVSELEHYDVAFAKEQSDISVDMYFKAVIGKRFTV